LVALGGVAEASTEDFLEDIAENIVGHGIEDRPACHALPHL
jgi:hypothetical protein